MQKRSVRVTLLMLLLAVTLAAASFLWTIDRRSHELTTAEDTIAARVERLTDAITAIGTAQQSYVAPGQLDEPWFERMAALIQQLNDDEAALGPLLHASDARDALQQLADSTGTLIAADRRTRQNLSLGQELMAADVIFSDGRNLLDGMTATLRELHSAERTWYRAELAALSKERWLVVVLTLLAWAGVVAALAATSSSASAARSVTQADSEEVSVDRPAATGAPDLAQAAALCTDLSRVTDTARLSDLLGRAASILDASGLILWMSAGEQLFPVFGHGYPPETLARFGPIARGTNNAAATAWRSGRLTTVAGDETSNGAVVAPMFGPDACIGVLAVEIRQGLEEDLTTQAVTTMIAAQLATVVAAWPAASSAQSPITEPEARSA